MILWNLLFHNSFNHYKANFSTTSSIHVLPGRNVLFHGFKIRPHLIWAICGIPWLSDKHNHIRDVLMERTFPISEEDKIIDIPVQVRICLRFASSSINTTLDQDQHKHLIHVALHAKSHDALMCWSGLSFSPTSPRSQNTSPGHIRSNILDNSKDSGHSA